MTNNPNIILLHKKPRRSAKYLDDRDLTDVLEDCYTVACSVIYEEKIDSPFCRWVQEYLANYIWILNYAWCIIQEFFSW